MAEAPSNTHNKRSLFRTSHVCHRRHTAGRNQQVEEYKHTHTHTHTHTHARTNRPIPKSKVLLVTTLFFWKICFSLKTSDKKLI